MLELQKSYRQDPADNSLGKIKQETRAKSKEEQEQNPTAANTSIIGSSLQGKPIQATTPQQLRLSVD